MYKQMDVLLAIQSLQSQRGSYGITISDIAAAAGCCWRTAQNHAAALVTLGLLERNRCVSRPGSTGGGYVYTLRDDDNNS